MNNGIDWEGLTGKAMKDIDLDDKITIIVGKLINIEREVKNKMPFHSRMALLGSISIPILFSLFAWLTMIVFGVF